MWVWSPMNKTTYRVYVHLISWGCMSYYRIHCTLSHVTFCVKFWARFYTLLNQLNKLCFPCWEHHSMGQYVLILAYLMQPVQKKNVPHHLPHQKLMSPTLPFSLALGSFHYLSCDQNHVTFIGWHGMASHVMNNMLATLHTTITSNVTLWTMKLHECM